MFDRDFWHSKLGKTSLGCVAAMALMVAISTQYPQSAQPYAAPSGGDSLIDIVLMVELA
ncbi:MAG: hypothetical protein WA948_09345 [Pontixanthobacter sp.]